jgi:hypothetical protein
MKNKLFDSIGNTSSTEETLSTEMIDPQLNDGVVQSLKVTFEELIEAMGKYKPLRYYYFFINRKISKIINKIDSLLSSRFGITFKHTSGDGIGYAVFTAPPKNYNVLYKDIEDVYDNVSKYLNVLNKSEENIKDIPNIKDSERDYDDIMFRWRKSMDILENTLNTSGVIVDRQHAKIIGLPKEYTIFLVADFYGLINDLKLESKELVAVLLHEVGHAFTHIEYSYRTITNTSVLIDTIRENIEVKNMSYKESLILSYKDIEGKDLSSLKGKSEVTVTLNVLERFVKEHKGFNASMYGTIDSEQLADQFSGRFGLGVELITSLDKIYKHYGNYYLSEEFLASMTSYWLFAFLYGLIGTASIGAATIIGIAAIFFLGAIIIFSSIIDSIITIGGMNKEKIYDDKKQRLKRIRNEMVRMIRSSKLDKDMVKSILSQLDDIDKTINFLPEHDGNFLDKFMRSFTGAGKRLVELEKLEQMTEGLMENNLYIASAKLKQLQG